MSNIPDPISKEIIYKATNDDLITRNFKDFSKFLIDFNIISIPIPFISPIVIAVRLVIYNN